MSWLKSMGSKISWKMQQATNRNYRATNRNYFELTGTNKELTKQKKEKWLKEWLEWYVKFGMRVKSRRPRR